MNNTVNHFGHELLHVKIPWVIFECAYVQNYKTHGFCILDLQGKYISLSENSTYLLCQLNYLLASKK